MKEKGKELNNAILNKVASILNNMDSPMRLSIRINAEEGEAPTIEYCIEEFIPFDERNSYHE